MVYPNVVFEFQKLYNEAYVLIESNDIGMAVASTLQQDLEAPNILMSAARGRAGQVLSSGFGGIGQQYLGVRTTKQVKRVGCLQLKTLIEGNKLLFVDYPLLEEMTRFISKGESWEAEEGYHDDLMMCMVLFGWLANQEYFKELTNIDIRRDIEQQNLRYIEEDVSPFGIISDGHDYHNESGGMEVIDWETGDRVF